MQIEQYELNQWRKCKNLTCKQLGELVGCSDAMINLVERNLKRFGPTILQRFEDIFGLVITQRPAKIAGVRDMKTKQHFVAVQHGT